MTFSPKGEAEFKAWQEKTGAFLDFSLPNGETKVKKGGVLEGIPFAVKDNIAVAGRRLTCASALLADYISPYNAHVVDKLFDEGAVCIGKTNMDEFGMGSSTDNSALQKTNNPYDTSRVAGGSSGGSAAAVAAGLVPFALGSDTGGSVRQPASFCGVVGLKPTWGALSRYGLVAYASSLEQIGILADSVDRCRQVFSIIRGEDSRDQTSRPAYDAASGEKPCVIGVLNLESLGDALHGAAGGDDALSPEVKRSFEKAQDNLKQLGYELKKVDLPCLKYAVPAYYTIAAAEASANLARFDGIRYGKRAKAENPEQLVEDTRTAGFGREVKLRILLGTFVLRSGFQDRYYHSAQKIRAGIKRECEKLLGTADNRGVVDALLIPVFPTLAFGRGASALSPFMQKAADIYTCAANLAGLPALAFPASLENGLPSGIQIMGRSFSENALLDIAESYEAAFPFPHPLVGAHSSDHMQQ